MAVRERITEMMLRVGSLDAASSLTPDGRLRNNRLGTNRTISAETALRSSAVWACCRLRADLISTMPVQVFRKVSSAKGIMVDAPTPPVLIEPGGNAKSGIVSIEEHLYSSQFDLDRYGNSFGLITATANNGLPARIDLVPAGSVTLRKRDGVVQARLDGTWYDYDQVWHEKQYTTAGMVPGLSPISYAALNLSQYMSALEFAIDWFDNGTIPSGRLKNTKRTIDPDAAQVVKDRYKNAVQSREIFVHGSDWEYEMLAVPQNESQFLETLKASPSDIARFLGVPGDMIDAMVGGSSITYASITQRNLQLLIMNIGPAVSRRESAHSRLVPDGYQVKLDRTKLLEMDQKTLMEMVGKGVADRVIAPSEARQEFNLPPFTAEQLAEFAVLFPNKAPAPVPASDPNGAKS